MAEEEELTRDEQNEKTVEGRKISLETPRAMIGQGAKRAPESGPTSSSVLFVRGLSSWDYRFIYCLWLALILILEIILLR